MVLLSQAIPSTMVHDIEELDVQKGHVTVRGIVGSMSDAQAIASTLSEDKLPDRREDQEHDPGRRDATGRSTCSSSS